MKKRTANKIFKSLYAYKGFETERQPYTKAQQRRAIITLKIPVFIRPELHLCQQVRKPYSDASQFLNAAMHSHNSNSNE